MIPRDGYWAAPRHPNEQHIFGTTEGQYDIFYGVIWGTRSAFRVALVVMAISVLIGIVLGSLAGYFGGVLDEISMRITDIFLAFPALILAMAIVSIIGPSLKSVMIALTAVWWPSYARLIRGDILQVREEDYVEAARGLGASSPCSTFQLSPVFAVRRTTWKIPLWPPWSRSASSPSLKLNSLSWVHGSS